MEQDAQERRRPVHCRLNQGLIFTMTRPRGHCRIRLLVQRRPLVRDQPPAVLLCCSCPQGTLEPVVALIRPAAPFLHARPRVSTGPTASANQPRPVLYLKSSTEVEALRQSARVGMAYSRHVKATMERAISCTELHRPRRRARAMCKSTIMHEDWLESSFLVVPGRGAAPAGRGGPLQGTRSSCYSHCTCGSSGSLRANDCNYTLGALRAD